MILRAAASAFYLHDNYDLLLSVESFSGLPLHTLRKRLKLRKNNV